MVFFVCLAGIYSSYAQQRIDALEFVKNAPWDLTESEIDEKYKENSFELADSLKVSLAASSGGNLNFANKFLDEFCIGKYNGFTLYTINEETRKPDMLLALMPGRKQPNSPSCTENPLLISIFKVSINPSSTNFTTPRGAMPILETSSHKSLKPTTPKVFICATYFSVFVSSKPNTLFFTS